MINRRAFTTAIALFTSMSAFPRMATALSNSANDVLVVDVPEGVYSFQVQSWTHRDYSEKILRVSPGERHVFRRGETLTNPDFRVLGSGVKEERVAVTAYARNDIILRDEFFSRVVTS